MNRLGVFLLGSFVIVVMMRGIKPALAGLYNISNATVDMSMTEQAVWQLMPYIIPIVLFGILVAFLTGKIGGHRDGGGNEE